MKNVSAVLSLLLLAFVSAAQRNVMEKDGWGPSVETGFSLQGSQKRIDLAGHLLSFYNVIYKDSAYRSPSGILGVGGFAGLTGFVNNRNIFRVGQQLGLWAIYTIRENYTSY